MWSSIGGLRGCSYEIGGGSEVRMAAMTLARLLPAKAWQPVNIS
jgi:hypothetical protein